MRRTQATRNQKPSYFFAHHRRAILVSAAIFIVFIGVLASIVIIREQNRFPIDKVTLKGNFKWLDPVGVKQVVLQNLHGDFFTVDMQTLKKALLTQPWIDQVSIRRVWPDGISVHIQERKPVAFWGKNSLITANATVFTPKELPQDIQLPSLYGPDPKEAKDVYSRFNKINDLLTPFHLHLVALSLSPRHAWVMQLQNGTEVLLGKQDTNARLERFLAVYEKVFADKQPKTVDMRYTNGMAVKW